MPKKILVVEDDEFLVDIITSRISVEQAFEVIQAKNGEQAIEKLGRYKIDLVLLDLIMPKVDGFVFLEKMRQNDIYQNIPVIVLSNVGDQEKIDQCTSLGITDYLIKAHFTPTEVVDKIKKILGEEKEQ